MVVLYNFGSKPEFRMFTNPMQYSTPKTKTGPVAMVHNI